MQIGCSTAPAFSSFFFFFLLPLYLCSKCNSFLGMLSCKSLLCTTLLQKFSVSAVMCTTDDATTIRSRKILLGTDTQTTDQSLQPSCYRHLCPFWVGACLPITYQGHSLTARFFCQNASYTIYMCKGQQQTPPKQSLRLYLVKIALIAI